MCNVEYRIATSSAQQSPRLCLRLVPATQQSASGSRGFTFIEVLFSIIILGVGMIMIAGMLPVAIKQTADARNDLTAKVVCDSGYAYLRTLAQTHPEAFPRTNGENTVGGGKSINTKASTAFDDFMSDKLMGLDSGDEYTVSGNFASGTNPTVRRAGRVIPLSFDVIHPDSTFDVATMMYNHAYNNQVPKPFISKSPESDAYPLVLQQLALGDRVVSSEPRFQWLGFYRRDEDASLVKLILVAMRMPSNEATDHYGANTTIPQEAINARNGPFLVPVEIEDSLTESDKVKFVSTSSSPYDALVAETGSYLIIAHSPPKSGDTVTGDLNRPFRNNGRIFKLGGRREDLDSKANGARVWDLAPGYDLAPAGAGPDGILGSADDVPDGSMNTTQSFDENADAARAKAVAEYPISDTATVKGTTAWAWIIGRTRIDPTASVNTIPYNGPTQDLGVLTIDMPLP